MIDRLCERRVKGRFGHVSYQIDVYGNVEVGGGETGGTGEGFGSPTIHPPIRMHGPMPEILPAVAEEDGDPESHCRFQNPVHHLGDSDLPRRKAVRRVLIDGEERPNDHCRLARRNHIGSAKRAGIVFQGLANAPRVDAHAGQDPRDGATSVTEPARPHRNVVLRLPVEISWLGHVSDGQA